MTDRDPSAEAALPASDSVMLDSVERAMGTVPKPLVRQILLIGGVAVALLVAASQSGVPELEGLFLAGVGLLAATTVGAACIGRRPAIKAATAVLLLDLAAIGLMGLVPEGNGINLLVVLPAMWLAAEHRMKGVGITIAATAALVSLPLVLYFGVTAASVSRAVVLPILAAVCSLTVAGVAQIWIDQTKQLQEQGRRLEEALAEATRARAFNDAIVSTVQVGLVTLDRDGGFTFVNPRQEEFFALSHPDGHGGHAGDPGFVFAADRITPLLRSELPTVRAATGEHFSDVVVWVGKDPGERKALSVSAGPIRSEDGGLDGAVLVFSDITDLMSALKVKDDFVTSVSHELRTPLTSIMGFVDIVLEGGGPLEPASRRHLEVVQRNAVRLLRLVGDLLFTAQLGEGRIALDRAPTDLVLLVERAVAGLAGRASDEGVELRTHLPGRLVVPIDAARVAQLVENLVSNGIKYSLRDGSVAVNLRQEGHDAVLTVTDTGIGIAEADQKQLFTRFFRTEEVEARAIQGIGLGLAITKSIVDAHGGSIRVSSAPGAGSTFEVRLPGAAQEGPPGPGSQASGSAMQAVASLSNPTRS